LKDPAFAKFVVLVNGSIPAAILAWDAWNHQLGPNPPDQAIHVTGLTALTFLTLTLAVTPVRKITGLNWLSHFRRMLGLFAFFYASVHLFIFFGFERSFSVAAVVHDVVNQKFYFFGMTALLLMAPLAGTSTNGIIKRMGAVKWKRLHKLIYLVGIAAIIHFLLFGKRIRLTQEVFAVGMTILLGYRVVAWQLGQMRKNRVPFSATAS
jgi:sulfoxide reductase heme-binding subunit YedZ